MDSEPAGSSKLSWNELKGVVSDVRRQLSNLSSSLLPSSISFRTLKDGKTRIYFLSVPPTCWETTLMYSDVPNTSQPNSMKLQWQFVIESNFPNHGHIRKHSREEQLLCERKRMASWGINTYNLHSESGKIIFPAHSSLYQCVDNGYTNGPFYPTKLRLDCTGAKLYSQICPSNPDLVAFICNHDIWVTHTVSGSCARLTYAHKGGRNLADDPLSAGVPSYVMQEEFNRYQGYWWQPKCTGGIYRILYEEVDDGDVKIFCFPSSATDTGDVEEFRFPRTGCDNSKSSLKMVEFKLNAVDEIENICPLELPFSFYKLFSGIEYIVRVGWTPDSQYIWVQLLNRRQSRHELVLLSLNTFTEELQKFVERERYTPSGSKVQIIYVESSEIWVNLHDLLYFFPMTSPNEIKFIWASEETGFRHLYLISTEIMPYSNGTAEARESMTFNCLHPRNIISKVALTSGDWEVAAQDIWVDVEKELVYFMGYRETPLEKHLYVVSLQRPGEIRLLTRAGYTHMVDFNEERSMLVTLYSNIKKPPSCQVFGLSHSDWTVEGIRLTPLGFLIESKPVPSTYHGPQLYTRQISSGDILYAMVFKPHNFEPNKKYPTILNVYGGPEVQLVSNGFKGMRMLRMHMLASRGYVVVAIDSRGSAHRGLQFEGHIKCRMGTLEMVDQVEVLKWLADTLGFIDMTRLGIHGWSYGGYLSLMGLVQYPELFKVAIAGAPVTNWKLYDTGYTERYMDLLEHNPQGYLDGSVLSYINKFPDEENRLLIIHGLIDENVHFHHTSQLVNAMIKAGKPYQLRVYPNERHSLRHVDASKHYETTMLSFLQNYL